MQKPWFTYRNFVTVLAIIFVIWFVWNFYIIISYFLIAAVISLLGKPIVEFLDKIKFRRFHIPRWISALLAITVMSGLIAGAIALFIPLVLEQAHIISSIDTQRVANSLEEPFMRAEEFIVDFQGNQADSNTTLQGIINERLQEWMSFTSITTILNSLLGGIGSLIVGVFSVVFISFFFLRDERLFYEIIMTLTPTRYETNGKRILHSSKITLTRYFAGLILQSTVVFILVTAGLWIMGFKYALLIGFFCAIVNIIPYLGPIIGTLFALLVEITTTLSSNPDANIGLIILKIVILIQGVQLFDNYVSQPFIFSNTLKAHPLEIFFIVLVFGSLAGIPGMILAVPVYSFMRIIAREFFSEYKIVRRMTGHIE